MDGSRKLRLGILALFIVIVINVFHRRLLDTEVFRSNCLSRGSVQIVLRKPLAAVPPLDPHMHSNIKACKKSMFEFLENNITTKFT